MMFFVDVYQSSACDAPVGRRNKEYYGTSPHMSTIHFAAMESSDAYTEKKHSRDSKLFDKGRMKGFVKNTQNVIVVSFQGSDSLQDWFRNIQTLKKSYSGCQDCKIHSGFLKSYSPLKDEMLRKVNTLYQEHPKKILVTGHSLGGAMATLAAVDLVNAGYPVNLITFGAPRVGNKEFAQYVDRIVKGINLRVTYKNDIVTVIPNKGYRHAGQELHCIDHNKFHYYPANVDLLHARRNLLDHRMKNYLHL
ncbi:lipase-like [Xenia sp. Carnegie-2017]|uniref:lipase-like n=1 Tax=Xenia sp. Carnegie-2017 TaxID=2897299 RepID=UPI001F04C4CD|nr:lipase-like [Xenia sp. Carnegie-2017]